MRSNCYFIDGLWEEQDNELSCFWTPNESNNFYRSLCSDQSLTEIGEFCSEKLKANWVCNPNGLISCKCGPTSKTPQLISADGNTSEPYLHESDVEVVQITFSKCNQWRLAPKNIWESLGYTVTDDIARWADPVTEKEKSTSFNINTKKICSDTFYLEQCYTSICQELGYEPFARGSNPVDGITYCICKT